MVDIKNYVKIHEAVQAFCEWSLPSIETCIRQWHQNQQGTLSPCQQPSTCPSYKKPTAKSKACQSCIDWGCTVEAELYKRQGRDEYAWRNVNPTILHKDVVEVAKGFVFILPNAQSCANFDDFDIGGILKMMSGFKGYHGGDQACVDKIQKVVGIRNDLSHMKVQQQMHISNAKTNQYFLNLKDLVTDLEGRHACLQSNTIMTLLDKIQQSDMTDDRIQRAMKPLTDGLQQALEELKLMKEEMRRLQPKPGDRKNEDLLDVQAVRKKLIAEYKQTRSQVQLLPGIPEECASMDEIFVDMTLCEQQNDSSVRRRELQTDDDLPTGNIESRNLESHKDLFTIKDKQGQRMKHILVRGNPGCGKSTLISKLAYDWAKNEDSGSVYAQFQLVFAIDFKEVLPEMDLFDVITDQLLPKVSKEDLERYIEHNSESVVFLLDGYDETYSSFPGKCRDFKSVLSGTLFSESFVIMTTRPHKVAAINAKYKINYTHVEVFGLPILSIFKYVAKFFHVPLENIKWINWFSSSLSWQSRRELKDVREIEPPGNCRRDAENVASLLVQIVESDHLLQICQCPMILTMVCFSWQEDQDLSLILTVLYHEAVVHVAKNRGKENSDGDIDVQSIRKDVDQLLLKVGKIALDGLLQDKLIFTASKFEDDTLNDACKVGLVSKERKRSKLDPVVRVQFIHKTFQEMSAAYYWARLAESDESLFRSYQKQVDDMEDNEMVLRFCCGESVTAAESIIDGAVEKSCLSRKRVYNSKTTEKCFLGHPSKFYDPWRLPLLLLFEVDHNIGKNEIEHLHSLLRPLVSNLSIAAVTNKSNGEVWAVLKSFSMKAQSDTSTWFASVTEVIIASRSGQGFIYGRTQFLEEVPIVSLLVSHMSNLKRLIISSGFHHEVDCSCLLQKMIESPKASKSLRAFVLESFKFQPQVMANFLTRQKCLTTLQIGDPCSIRIVTDSEQMIVDSVVTALKQKPLQMLILDHMGINCKKVFDMLSKAGRKLPLTKLSLQQSCMVDGSIQSFAEAVHFLPDLKTLNLRRLFRKEDGIEEKDFKVFGPALRYLQNLIELDLSGHIIGNSVKEFSQGLQYLTKLQKIILFSTGLMGELIGFLPFECLTELRALYLGGNKIGKGIAKLSEKLKFLTNLRDFEFGGAELTDDDVALLPLSSFNQLISLDLGDNSLWSEGLCTIAKQLKHIPKLQKLRLIEQQSSVSDEVSRGICHAKGVIALLDGLASMSHISSAILPGMCVPRSDFRQSQDLAFVRERVSSGSMHAKEITHNGQAMVKISAISSFRR